MDTVKYAAKVAGAVAVFHIIFICLYVFLVSKAQIPTRHVVKTTMDFLPSDVKPTDKQATDFYLATTINDHFVSIKLGFLNCCTLHLTVIGSILLIFLGGYGLRCQNKSGSFPNCRKVRRSCPNRPRESLSD